MITKTPEPPYYAVIFTSFKTNNNEGYAEMAEIMQQLAEKQPGYLGMESARENTGITVSYWKDLKSIKKWKQNTQHTVAQQNGKKFWYKAYATRIAKVERDYFFAKEE